MQRLAEIISKNKHYFAGFLVYATAGLLLNLIYTQQQLFFFVNHRNTNVYDKAMPYITFIGDGIFFVVVIVILFLIKIRYGIISLVAWLVATAWVQIFKQVIFTDHPRPWKRWGNDFDIHLIEGFNPYINNSFPSGHTASAFCLFTLLAFFVPRKILGFLFLIMAILVAYSRIYLAQHYFIDTYVGAWFGVLSALGIYYYFYSPKFSFNQRESKLERPLLKFRK